MLTIVGNMQAHEDKTELLKAELHKLIEPTLKEPGCVQYDLHQDNNVPSRFLFFENWDSREQWQDHMKTSHIAAFMKATEGAIAESSTYEMTRVK